MAERLLRLSDHSATFFHYCYSLINNNFSYLSWGGSSCTQLLHLACVDEHSEIIRLFWSEYRVVTFWEDSADTEHQSHGIHSWRALAEPIQRFASLRAGFCSFYWWQITFQAPLWTEETSLNFKMIDCLLSLTSSLLHPKGAEWKPQWPSLSRLCWPPH